MSEAELDLRDLPVEEIEDPAEALALGRPAPRVTVIKPATGWPTFDVRELWAYRELALRLVWRDIMVRYKQTVIGVAWVLFQPAVTTLIYALVYGKFAKFPAGQLPYPLLALSGLIPAQYFQAALTRSSGSIVSNVNLVTKVYFPRVLMPISAVIGPLVDLAFACVLLVAVMAWYGIWPESPVVVLAPLFILLSLVTALGTGLFLSAVNVRFRDVPYVIPLFMQILPLVSGVPYDVSELPEKWQWLLYANPLTAVIAGWRWTVLNAAAPDPAKLAVSLGVAALLVTVGLAFFRRSEPKFADAI